MKEWFLKKWSKFENAGWRLQVMLVLFIIVLLMMAGAGLAVYNA